MSIANDVVLQTHAHLNTAHIFARPTTPYLWLPSTLSIPKGMDVNNHAHGYVHSKHCPLCHLPYHSVAITAVEYVYTQGHGGANACPWVCPFQAVPTLPAPLSLQPLLLSGMVMPKGMDIYTHAHGYVHSKRCTL